MLKNGWIFILRIFFVCILIASMFSPAKATVTPKANNHHFEIVKAQLIKDGFDPDEIQRLYSRPQITFEADGVSILFTYSEATVDYDQFANDWSIRKAKQYMQTHWEDLQRTEQAFGVDSQVITAILLVETGLGSTVGTRSTLNTLSTIASLMDPQVRSSFWDMTLKSKKISRKKFEKKAVRKSQWAYQELKAFLTYAYREGFDPVEIPGSIAGAIGYAQFMPSNILAYGKDGNDDGVVDLHNHADAMASIANFLKRHGWRPGLSRKKAEKVIYHYNHSDYYVNVVLKIVNLLKG